MKFKDKVKILFRLSLRKSIMEQWKLLADAMTHKINWEKFKYKLEEEE